MLTLLRAATAALFLALLPACTITKTAHPVMVAPGESRAIAVIENSDVTGDYLSILKTALANKGFSVTTLPAGTPVGASPLTATYEAEWSWDFVTYLARSIITIYRNGAVAGDSLYDAPKAGTSLNADIYESTESKIVEMVDRLFPATSPK